MNERSPGTFISAQWADEIQKAYINALVLGRGYYHLPPLTRWQRVKRFLRFYEARRRISNAWQCMRYGRDLE